MFIFNTQLLLIGIDSLWHLLLVVATRWQPTCFCRGDPGLVPRTRWMGVGGAAAGVFHPVPSRLLDGHGVSALQGRAGDSAVEVVGQAPAGERLRIWIEGLSIEGKEVKEGRAVTTWPCRDGCAQAPRYDRPEGDAGARRRESRSLAVGFGQAEKLGIERGFDITAIELPSDRPAKGGCSCPR